MNAITIINKKKLAKQTLLGEYFESKKKVLGLVCLQEDILTDDFLEGLSILDVNFLLKSDSRIESKYKNIVFTKEVPKDLEALDFVLCDECEENMSLYFQAGVVPIVSKDNVVYSLLEEFNPAKVTGNAYVFANCSKWETYYALIRFLENYKFPYDHKALVKNVLAI